MQFMTIHGKECINIKISLTTFFASPNLSTTDGITEKKILLNCQNFNQNLCKRGKDENLLKL